MVWLDRRGSDRSLLKKLVSISTATSAPIEQPLVLPAVSQAVSSSGSRPSIQKYSFPSSPSIQALLSSDNKQFSPQP
jgi:hypothetical protein